MTTADKKTILDTLVNLAPPLWRCNRVLSMTVDLTCARTTVKCITGKVFYRQQVSQPSKAIYAMEANDWGKKKSLKN